MSSNAPGARAQFSAVTFPTLRDDREAGDHVSRARGHSAGYTAGLRAAAADLDARIARLDAEQATAVSRGQARVERAVALLTAAADALHTRTLPLLQEVEHTLVASALELAEAILGRELGDAEPSARAALRRALVPDPAGTGCAGTVRMNPGDLELIDLGTRAECGVVLVADATLARGDAIAEFPDGFLDARIATALGRAKAALLGADS